MSLGGIIDKMTISVKTQPYYAASSVPYKLRDTEEMKPRHADA